MYQVKGAITVTAARAAFEAGLQAIADGHREFDLAQLAEVDSVAVATLLAWQRAAADKGSRLVFHHLPENLRTLAQLYNAGTLLATAAAEH